jgi:hypothetical protein
MANSHLSTLQLSFGEAFKDLAFVGVCYGVFDVNRSDVRRRCVLPRVGGETMVGSVIIGVISACMPGPHTLADESMFLISGDVVRGSSFHSIRQQALAVFVS